MGIHSWVQIVINDRHNKMVRQSTPAPAIYDSKSVTVRGMIPNADQHLLFTVKFSDKQMAQNLMFLLSANNPEAALAIMRQSDSLDCQVLPTLDLEAIPEGEEC